jgi:hypothetical protein
MIEKMKLRGLDISETLNYNVLSPKLHIHVSVSDLYSPKINLPILLQENKWIDPGKI